jgi:selenocysteine-specific elongation factor
MRTALNLQGLDREEIARGAVAATPGALAMVRAVDVLVRVVKGAARGLRHRDRVLVHAGTAQVAATVSLFEGVEVAGGGEGVARLLLDAPGAALCGGERFIVRATGPVTGYGRTLGGGAVLDPDPPGPPRRARRDARTTALLRTLANASLEERLAALVEEGGATGPSAGAQGGAAGVTAAALWRRTGAPRPALDKALGKLATTGAIVRFDKERDAFAGAGQLAALAERARTLVAEFHRSFPMRPGLGREELRTRLGGGGSGRGSGGGGGGGAGSGGGSGGGGGAASGPLDARLFHALLARLPELQADAQVVRTKDFRPRADGSSVVDEVRKALAAAALEPPRTEEMVPAATRDEVKEALAYLVRNGDAVRTRDGLCFDRAAIDTLRARLVAHLREHTEITAQQFKAMVGASRKFAIPLAEHFDAEKLTIRVGEKRVLRRA